jgi:chromosome partitioning protein
MTVADILISPARPSQYDLDTLPHLAEVYSQAKDLNPKLNGYLILNLCPTNPVIKEVAAAKEFLVDYPEFKLANTLVYDRKAYRDAISEGKSVLEWTDAKAKHEIEALVGEIING